MTKIFPITTNQQFLLDFAANGVSYRLLVQHNAYNDGYFLSVQETVSEKYVIQGLTLSTGVDLLSQFGIFRLYILPTKPEFYEVNPTSSNITSYQIWVEDDE